MSKNWGLATTLKCHYFAINEIRYFSLTTFNEGVKNRTQSAILSTFLSLLREDRREEREFFSFFVAYQKVTLYVAVTR